MSKSTIEIKTAFEGCAELCDRFKLDLNGNQCVHTGYCEKIWENFAKLSGQTNPLDDLFADSFDKLDGLGV